MLIIPNFNTIGSGAARGGGAPPFEYTAIDNNYSMEFDGIDTSIQITPLNIDTTNGVTLSCWVKSNGFTTWDYLCTNGNTGGTSSLLNLRFSGSGSLYSNSFGGSAYTGLGGFADGNWHHIIMTINYTTGDVKFYKDGVVSATVLTWGSASTNTIVSSIGAINSSGVGSMSGSIDEFAIFNSVLSEDTIEKIYNTTNDNPGKVADLSETPEGAPTAWYRFE